MNHARHILLDKYRLPEGGIQLLYKTCQSRRSAIAWFLPPSVGCVGLVQVIECRSQVKVCSSPNTLSPRANQL